MQCENDSSSRRYLLEENGAHKKHNVANLQSACLSAWCEGIATMYGVNAKYQHTYT